MTVYIWNEINEEEKKRFLARDLQGVVRVQKPSDIRSKVRDILLNIRQNGDQALSYYTALYDDRIGPSFKVELSPTSWEKSLSEAEKNAIRTAHKNISQFHELQRPGEVRLDRDGCTMWREYSSIDRVGIYVPAGTAPLVSTLLMLACPARIAGCKEIVLASPLKSRETLDPAIGYAASLCGINEIYSIGGAHAIAALAYGTESIPKVLKIFGPGNQFVNEAKMHVSRDTSGCSIDIPAGPSEVLVLADATARPDFVASDLLAQAEHDPNARSVLISICPDFIGEVRIEIDRQAKRLSRQSILRESLPNINLILCDSLQTAIEVSNAYAPEHLILQVSNPTECSKKVTNAGSVFIGPWSAEALGDFATGPNHVLPTGGFANSYGGVGLESFMKSITFQEVRKEGFMQLAETAFIMGGLEKLDGHQASIAIRRKALEQLNLQNIYS